MVLNLEANNRMITTNNQTPDDNIIEVDGIVDMMIEREDRREKRKQRREDRDGEMEVEEEEE